MPVSRVRKPRAVTPVRPAPRKRAPSPAWFGALLVGLFVIGVVWLVLYYTTGGGIVGQRALGGWNVFAGFAFICVGFALATRWR